MGEKPYFYTLQMNTLSRRAFFIIVFSLGLHSMIFSAPAPPPSGGPGCWPPPCIPIDGGIGFLMAAGAAYGAKKMLSGRKKSTGLKS